ncbi:Adenylate Cyclase Type 7 [Manis pentadactyla]|nr:Adenylate Cyclase Type 7 [Manis pentadactyla]
MEQSKEVPGSRRRRRPPGAEHRIPQRAGARAGAAETDNGLQLSKKVVDAKRKVTISHPFEWNWMLLGAHVGWQ